MALYFGYVEVAGHANGGERDHQRYLQALQEIKKAAFGKAQVLHIIEAANGQEPVKVKHFGWNAKCTPRCDHEGEAYGVLRYFGLYLVTQERIPHQATLGTWRIGPRLQLTIAGLEQPNQVVEGRYSAQRL